VRACNFSRALRVSGNGVGLRVSGAHVLVVLLLLVSFAPALRAADQPSAAAGEQLFAGAAAFRNGGPPCAACHSIAGLGFPNGGTMGPDLTRTAARFGDVGMDAALQTLFFPAMTPIFDPRPLTVDEQRDLKAFFQQLQSRRPPEGITLELAALACTGFVVLLALAWAIWRRRLPGVRRTLLARPARSGTRS
jgi:cytochrome c553